MKSRRIVMVLLTAQAVVASPPPPQVLEFDFPAVHVGFAEYDAGPTGTTVFYFPARAMAVVDVRGGAPATVLTDLLRLGSEARMVDAIAFAGGSAYGLSAAGGVAAEIRDRRQNSGEWRNIAVVPGAIIFDLGERRFNTVSPDEALGRAALRAAGPGHFPLGARGAGRFATQGVYFGARKYSGQGGAFRQAGPTKVAVFTVVNAVGTVVDRSGQVVRCGHDPAAGPCGPISEHLSKAARPRGPRAAMARDVVPTENTTITLVVTNQNLRFQELQRLATQVHTSMARAIQPFHTDRDGDTLFAATTAEVDNPDLAPADLSVLASEAAWDAVLTSVPPLEPLETRTIAVTPELCAACTGRYELGPGALLAIHREGDKLWGEAAGTRPIYAFPLKQRVEILPTSEVNFIVKGQPEHRLRFLRDGGGRVTGLLLNPGHWQQPARKVQ